MHFGLDLGDPGLDLRLLVELITDLSRVLDVRRHLSVSGLAVEPFGDQPTEAFVESVGEARHGGGGRGWAVLSGEGSYC